MRVFCFLSPRNFYEEDIMLKSLGKWFVPVIVSVMVAGCASVASQTPIPPTGAPTAIAPIATATALPPTETPQATPLPKAGAVETRGADHAPMVYVPAGEFLMGSSEQDIKDVKSVCRGCNYDDEKPQHKVYLDAFWMDQHELTNAQYAQCVSAGNCQAPSIKASLLQSEYYGNKLFDNYPVVYVTWDDANKFCAWAGKRLPTEAEWEKAARGTDGWIYPWGNQWEAERANVAAPNTAEQLQVGHYPSGASPYGALDMAGNVWEWVADWYDANYYSRLEQSQNAPPNNPHGPSSGSSRVLRGGSAFSDARMARTAVRGHLVPATVDHSIGFRCAQ